MNHIHRIITDADLDGVITAAIVRACFPRAEVHFTRAAAIRAGEWDPLIDAGTAVCDLPLSAPCGLYIDHHTTNAPTPAQPNAMKTIGGQSFWRIAPSAARVAWEALDGARLLLPEIAAMMPMVDAIDAGTLSDTDYLTEPPLLTLARCLSEDTPALLGLLVDHFSQGSTLSEILTHPRVRGAIGRRRVQRAAVLARLPVATTITDRLAVVRMENTGLKPSGLLVSAFLGDAADACIVIHGEQRDGVLPGASLYTNSFLHRDGGLVNLSVLATRFDPHGGGHHNAAGCRIMPVAEDALGVHLDTWQAMWREARQRVA